MQQAILTSDTLIPYCGTAFLVLERPEPRDLKQEFRIDIRAYTVVSARSLEKADYDNDGWILSHDVGYQDIPNLSRTMFFDPQGRYAAFVANWLALGSAAKDEQAPIPQTLFHEQRKSSLVSPGLRTESETTKALGPVILTTAQLKKYPKTAQALEAAFEAAIAAQPACADHLGQMPNGTPFRTQMLQKYPLPKAAAA